jgi:hypothetical protein
MVEPKRGLMDSDPPGRRPRHSRGLRCELIRHAYKADDVMEERPPVCVGRLRIGSVSPITTSVILGSRTR